MKFRFRLIESAYLNEATLTLQNAISHFYGNKVVNPTNINGEKEIFNDILTKCNADPKRFKGYSLHHANGDHFDKRYENYYLMPTNLHNGITSNVSQLMANEFRKDGSPFKNWDEEQITKLLWKYVQTIRNNHPIKLILLKLTKYRIARYLLSSLKIYREKTKEFTEDLFNSNPNVYKIDTENWKLINNKSITNKTIANNNNINEKKYLK